MRARVHVREGEQPGDGDKCWTHAVRVKSAECRLFCQRLSPRFHVLGPIDADQRVRIG